MCNKLLGHLKKTRVSLQFPFFHEGKRPPVLSFFLQGDASGRFLFSPSEIGVPCRACVLEWRAGLQGSSFAVLVRASHHGPCLLWEHKYWMRLTVLSWCDHQAGSAAPDSILFGGHSEARTLAQMVLLALEARTHPGFWHSPVLITHLLSECSPVRVSTEKCGFFPSTPPFLWALKPPPLLSQTQETASMSAQLFIFLDAAIHQVS